MQLGIPTDSLPVQEMFERFFATEASTVRVRAAEPIGFDAQLWRQLVELEAPMLRVSERAGGADMSLFDACLMMSAAGRRLAPVPLAEAVVALRLLGEIGAQEADNAISAIRSQSDVVTVALRTAVGEAQLVPGGAAANAILTYDGRAIAIERPTTPLSTPNTLGGSGIGLYVQGSGERTVIADGNNASGLWNAAIEEWKILTSAALIGMSDEALSMGAAYACERVAFGQPIGANQGIAHPLADAVIDVDGGEMLLWRTLRAIADGAADAGALVSLLFWWTSRAATVAVAKSLHTFGGYGLSNEYDIQLYHRRAKAWPLVLGDPQDELIRGGRRLLLGETTALPEVGAVSIDFEAPDGGEALAAETRALLEGILDPAKHKLHDHSFESHDWDVHRALGAARLLFPDWPEEFGGRGADAASTRASLAVWQDLGYTPPPRSTTALVGSAILQFGTPELQAEVLPRFASGEVTAALGYTEPSGGSDVFAAKTRAVCDGDEWVINGQKMFTSGAEWASFVFLITRTDPDVPKHKGLTMFLVPLDASGVEVHPVHTFMDERTNATFYSDVRIPDRYRIGEINGGTRVMASALSGEQGGGYYHKNLRAMAKQAEDYARRAQRDGRPLIESDNTLARLARVHADAYVAEAIGAKVLGKRLAGEADRAYGPAAKVFSTEAFITDSADLIDLAAPASLIRGDAGLGMIEMGYRHSTATTIYGGTSEVLRSMVAERRLGLPRSRT